MRNYQYSHEEEEEMDAFANSWKKENRGVKGPAAWREFKQKHPWAKRLTADALRQKYTNMKRDQYWRAFAVTHANNPGGRATCAANHNLQQGMNNYIAVSTESLAPSSMLPGFAPSEKMSTESIPTTPANVHSVRAIPNIESVLSANKTSTASKDVTINKDPAKLPQVKGAVELSDAYQLSERVLQLKNGDLVLRVTDGSQMLVPANKSSGVQSVSMRELLGQIKRVLFSYVEGKFKKFEESVQSICGPNENVLMEMHSQLKSNLAEGFDMLMESELAKFKC